MSVSSLATKGHHADRHPGIAQQYPGPKPEWRCTRAGTEEGRGVLPLSESQILLRNSGMTTFGDMFGVNLE
jgi:hypothetical protein